MDQNMKDLLETVIFIKDNMATKDDLAELEERMEKLDEKLDEQIGGLRKEMQAGFQGVASRMGAMDNRIDDESFARTDLEHRVRAVLPTLPVASART